MLTHGNALRSNNKDNLSNDKHSSFDQKPALRDCLVLSRVMQVSWLTPALVQLVSCSFQSKCWSSHAICHNRSQQDFTWKAKQAGQLHCTQAALSITTVPAPHCQASSPCGHLLSHLNQHIRANSSEWNSSELLMPYIDHPEHSQSSGQHCLACSLDETKSQGQNG